MSVVIDSHQHFWSLARGDYEWLTPELAGLYRDFTPKDLAPLLSKAGVRYTVLVQAAATVAETQHLLNIAETTDFVAGVVGWVDFDVTHNALESLEKFSQQKKFVGVRPMIHDINDPTWILRESHRSIFNKIIELGLSFDALVRTEHLPYLQQLLAQHPKLRLVIDHGAKPGIREGTWLPWASDLKAIAQSTNVFCKLSGILTEAAVNTADENIIPYLDYLLDCFGPERLIWGSDWPVLNLNGNYVEWLSTVKKWLVSQSKQSQSAILGQNANHFYRLGLQLK